MREIRDANDLLLAIVDNVANFKPGLAFYGTRDHCIQVGQFRYDKNKVLRDHKHIARHRNSWKTQEILIVFKGSCGARTFDDENNLVDTRILKEGDFYISYYGGVGFTVLENDTRMMEIKNGPYDVKNDDEDRILL